MNQKNLLKGSIIALLCVALIAGIVLSVAQPDKPDDDRLSNVETTPTNGETSAPTEKPTAPDEPQVPETEPGSQGPAIEAPEKQPGSRPTEPKPVEPAPTEPGTTEPEATEPEEPENKVTILTGDIETTIGLNNLAYNHSLHDINKQNIDSFILVDINKKNFTIERRIAIFLRIAASMSMPSLPATLMLMMITSASSSAK
jgi:hypothetical protein